MSETQIEGETVKDLVPSENMSPGSVEEIQNEENDVVKATSLNRSSSCGSILQGNGLNKMKNMSRRVSFPSDDKLISGYNEPRNPWEHAHETTTEDLIQAYTQACQSWNVRPITKLLLQLQEITDFTVRANSLTLKGEKLEMRVVETLESIFKRVQFITIDLEATSLEEDAGASLFDMIEYYESAVNVLVGFNKNLGNRGWQAAAHMMRKMSCLRLFDGHSVPLSIQASPFVGRALRLSNTLVTLHLENAFLSGRPLLLIVAALRMNTTLRELFLADNEFTVMDALQIANLLKFNRILQLLDLRNNPIQDLGLGHLAAGLMAQTASCGPNGPTGGLQTLVLWNNKISQEGMAKLSMALRHTVSLSTLNLGQNVLGDDGMLKLKEGLLQNHSLLRLGLVGTKLTDEGAVAVAEYLAESPRIIRLDLRNNDIKVAGLMALSLAFKINSSLLRLDIDKPNKRDSLKELAAKQECLLNDMVSYAARNKQAAIEKAQAAAARQEEERKAAEKEKTELRYMDMTNTSSADKTEWTSSNNSNNQPSSQTTQVLTGVPQVTAVPQDADDAPEDSPEFLPRSSVPYHQVAPVMLSNSELAKRAAAAAKLRPLLENSEEHTPPKGHSRFQIERVTKIADVTQTREENKIKTSTPGPSGDIEKISYKNSENVNKTSTLSNNTKENPQVTSSEDVCSVTLATKQTPSTTEVGDNFKSSEIKAKENHAEMNTVSLNKQVDDGDSLPESYSIQENNNSVGSSIEKPSTLKLESKTVESFYGKLRQSELSPGGLVRQENLENFVAQLHETVNKSETNSNQAETSKCDVAVESNISAEIADRGTGTENGKSSGAHSVAGSTELKQQMEKPLEMAHGDYIPSQEHKIKPDDEIKALVAVATESSKISTAKEGENRPPGKDLPSQDSIQEAEANVDQEGKSLITMLTKCKDEFSGAEGKSENLLVDDGLPQLSETKKFDDQIKDLVAMATNTSEHISTEKDCLSNTSRKSETTVSNVPMQYETEVLNQPPLNSNEENKPPEVQQPSDQVIESPMSNIPVDVIRDKQEEYSNDNDINAVTDEDCDGFMIDGNQSGSNPERKNEDTDQSNTKESHEVQQDVFQRQFQNDISSQSTKGIQNHIECKISETPSKQNSLQNNGVDIESGSTGEDVQNQETHKDEKTSNILGEKDSKQNVGIDEYMKEHHSKIDGDVENSTKNDSNTISVEEFSSSEVFGELDSLSNKKNNAESVESMKDSQNTTSYDEVKGSGTFDERDTLSDEHFNENLVQSTNNMGSSCESCAESIKDIANSSVFDDMKEMETPGEKDLSCDIKSDEKFEEKSQINVDNDPSEEDKSIGIETMEDFSITSVELSPIDTRYFVTDEQVLTPDSGIVNFNSSTPENQKMEHFEDKDLAPSMILKTERNEFNDTLCSNQTETDNKDHSCMINAVLNSYSEQSSDQIQNEVEISHNDLDKVPSGD